MIIGNTKPTRMSAALFLSVIVALAFAPSAWAQLTGTKTIGGASPDYATIRTALEALNAQGTAAPGVTFVIRTGTYAEDSLLIRTSTSSASAPIIIKPDAGATVTINVLNGYGAAIKIDSTAYVTIDGSNSGTTSRDMTINALNTVTQHGVWVSGQSYFTTIKNCNIRCNNLTGASGIHFLYTSVAGGNPNNSIADNNFIKYVYRGIYGEGNTTTDLINDLTIRNNVIDSARFAGIYVWYVTRPFIYNNDVSVPFATSTIYGIYVGSTVLNARVYSNKIHDLMTTSTTAATYGLYVAGTSTLAQNAFFNNFIWNLNPPSGGTGAIYGIYHSTANTTIADTIAYNSVNLTGTTTGNKTTYAYYRASSTGPAFLRNNIFQNTRTDGTTGVAYAIYKTTTTTVLNSNNNNLYVGTPNAQHQTGRIGTTNYATLADWRTANSSDAASIAENTPFVSATDLHIQTTVPTQLESGGTPVTAITSDIDGDTRNATTPDIGADEFAGIPQDLTPPIITYTPLNNTGQTGARTLTATITDASGVPTTGIGLPRVYWKKHTDTSFTGVAGTFVSGSQYSFTFGAGVADGDTVSYFVVAQDNASPPNVGAFPSQGAGGLLADPPRATTPPTNPSRYVVRQPMAGGDYTVGLTLFERVIGKDLTTRTFTRRVLREVPVGPEIDHKSLGPTTTASITPYQKTELREIEETYTLLMDGEQPYAGPTRVFLTDDVRGRLGLSSNVLAVYPTITAAVNDLNVRGVAGSIRFLLVDSAYTSETLPIVIQVNNDSVPTASKTVTIKPNTGINATISGALASGPVFRILSSYITIDGSNAPSGTSRNLTIQNTSATSPQVVVFGSLGTTPITNGTLMNCNIINGALTSSAVIISDGTTAGSPGYFSSITIKNNHIRKAYIGVYANGGAAPTQNGSNLVYESNVFTPVGADSMRYIGLYMQGVNGATVRRNEMGFFSGVTSEDDKGIWLASGTTNAVVEQNFIHDLVYFGTGGYGGHGIYVSSVMTGANNVLRNNMIANLAGDGWNYTTIPTDNPIGIVFSGAQSGNSAYYNSIHLYGSRLNQTNALSMGIYLGTGSEATIVNNIIVNNLGLSASTGYGATCIYAATSNSQFTNINYNNYFANAPSPTLNIIGKIGASDYTTLAAWQAASGGDTNSISGSVNFVSPTDLHIVPYLPSIVDSAATPIAGITTDYDGQTRNATRPDIGADEFTRVVLPPPAISNIVRSTRVPLAGDTVVVTCTITDTIGISTANLIYNVNDTINSVSMTLTSGTPQNGTWRGVVPGSAHQNGNRVELQVQANSTSGQSTTTPKAGARSYYAGISPLSLTGLRRMHPNGRIMDSLYYVRVTGTVNGPNFQTTNLGYHFQDAVGGIQLFSFGITRPPLNLGDSIIVVGRLAQFRGLTEVIPDTQTTDIQVVATGRSVTPTTVSVATFNANPEQYESRLVRMTSLQRRDPTPPWPSSGTSANIVMYQNVVTDTIIMRIDSDTEIPGSPEPSYPVNVTGVISQFSSATSVYNNGYQTQPRYLTDFQSPGLSGTYTVGSGGQYPTLDSAFADIARGITGPVTLSLIDSLYTPVGRLNETDAQALRTPRTVDMETDDGQVVTIDPRAEGLKEEPTDSPEIVGITLVGPIPGASATNRVTIRPANNVRARIVGTGAATFNFRNVSYVTFDGVSTTGPTQLSIENSTAGGIAIALLGNSDNNIIQNLTIRSPYASGVGVYADTASGAAPDSNTISGNTIPVSLFGVYLRGGNFIARGNRILNNQLGSDSLGAVGIYNQQVAGSVIANNRVENVKDASAAGSNIAGIWIATRQLNLRVYSNVINGVRTRPGATGAAFTAGIYYFGTSTDTTRSVFYNNMIYGVENFTSSASGTLRALYASTSRLDTVVYNTIYVTGAAAGPIISGALYLGTPQLLTIRNNIAMNTLIASGTGRALALYGLSTAATFTSNYNDLYVPAQQTGSHIAAITTTNYTTLPAWVASGRDSQSVSVVVHFRAPDLHVDSTIVTPINGGATPIASITTDIDGQTRNATAPDIGADEFTPGAPPAPGWTVQTSGVTNYLYSVKAVNQSVAWAAGAGGTVIRTVNGGGTWTSVGGGAIGTNDIYNIEALDANTAFVTTSPSATFIFRTTNGGATWQQVYTDAASGAFINAISMLNPSVGMAEGDPTGGRWTILYTNTGGTTWVRDTVNAPLQQGTEFGTQNGLARVGTTHAWFTASQGGRIYRTTNGGASWSSSSVPTATGTSNVWFNDTQYGVATSSGSNLVFRSTDGGATWTSITPSGSGFLLACAGSGTSDFWYARGTSIYRSTDRGATFTSSHTGTGTYVALSFSTLGSNTTGWGVTSTGGVARFFGTITDVEEQPTQGLPETFALLQNYPNPFNPTTTIRYALPRDARVTVSVYNILGQLVSELVNDVQSAGYYTVAWNGRNQYGLQVATGVYLYRIEARPTDGGAPFVSTKKMVLMK